MTILFCRGEPLHQEYMTAWVMFQPLFFPVETDPALEQLSRQTSREAVFIMAEHVTQHLPLLTQGTSAYTHLEVYTVQGL